LAVEIAVISAKPIVGSPRVRVIGKVLVGGKDVGLEQIIAGLAWH